MQGEFDRLLLRSHLFSQFWRQSLDCFSPRIWHPRPRNCLRTHCSSSSVVADTERTRDLLWRWSLFSLTILMNVNTYLPPITLLSPLNTLVRLLTTTSAKGNTCTFKKLPMVSSITTAKPKRLASDLILLRLGAFRRGLPGNSQKSARNLSPFPQRCSKSSRSADDPWP